MLKKGSTKYGYEGLENLGYKLIKEEYLPTGENNRIKRYITIKDNEGYLYYTIDSNLAQYDPSRYHKANPYTMDNIKLYLNHINFPYQLTSSKYIDAKTKLLFIDKEGYLYSSTLDGILQGYIPTRFGSNSGKGDNPYAIHNIKLWMILNNINLELVSDIYKNNLLNLDFKDKDGYYYSCSFANLTQNHLPRRFDASNPYTISNIILWYTTNKKMFKLLSNTYKDNTTKLQWQCLKEGCKEEFEMNWADIQSGVGCNYCSGHEVGISNCLATKNPKLAKEWHLTKNGKLTPWDVTCGIDLIVWWQCGTNPKHTWPTSICNRTSDKNKNNCPYCSGRYPSEENNLLLDNPKLCEEWNYGKNDKKPEDYTPHSGKKVWWLCKECGHEWPVSIDSRNKKNGKGSGCPECNESHGEKRVKKWSGENNLPYDKQYSFDGLVGLGGNPLLYDVPIFYDEEKTQLRLLIEYDGEGHYSEKPFGKKSFQRTQAHDKIKNEYCIKNKILLIRIPYWEFDNIESILDNILITNNLDSKFIVNNW